MRIRHRIPTVFSLYMVDVFCCALGCVIFMWLTNLKASEEQKRQADDIIVEAKKREKEADERTALTAKLLADAEKRVGRTSESLQAATVDLADAYLVLADLNERMEKAEADKKDLENRLSVALKQARTLDETVKDKSSRVAVLEKDLAASLSQLKNARATAALVPDLRKDLKTTRDQLVQETTLAAALEKEVGKRTKDLANLNQTLADLRDTKTSLEKTVDARDKDLKAARLYKSKWEAAEERVQLLEKQMTERQKELVQAELSLAALDREKRTLTAEATRVKAAADARFAGIQLTGKRVVFLVDMSGSMELVDEKTPAPAKWSGVRETLVKIMRSLPDLEKFQVVIFSDKASFLFGGNSAWLDYDPRTSSDRVFKALAAIKPKGGTNMYTAMEMAFKLRGQGLDTIYFFSDGLPNMGEGLKPEQMAKMTEMQVGEVLGKHIRRKLKNDWNQPYPKLAPVRINTIGFFYESPDVGAFLWALARENEGSFVGMSSP